MTAKESMDALSPRKRFFQSVVYGVIVGFICGFVGAGGGMMMLLLLTNVLGYGLKTAVGTSVFIMTFTALTGSLVPDILYAFHSPLGAGSGQICQQGQPGRPQPGDRRYPYASRYRYAGRQLSVILPFLLGHHCDLHCDL